MKIDKIVLGLTVAAITLFGVELPLEKSSMHSFKKSLELNAKVIQLSNAQQSISSLVGGHLEKYYVKPAQDVKRGDKIALISSIEVSRMSAEYLSLKKQYLSVSRNYDSIEKLYNRGMTSMQKLNNAAIQKSEIFAKLNALESQLGALGIDTQNLKEATSNYLLYAHSDGRVSALLKPLHSVVNSNEALVAIVKNQAYYIKSYLPLEYAQKVKVGDTIVVAYNEKNIVTHVTQVMPKVDELTQRVVVLSSVDEATERLFINAYVKATLYFGDAVSYVAVKKSALSFFKNEWVVFTPNEQDHEADKDESKAEHKDEEHGEHEEDHHDEEPEFSIRVVEIITQDDAYVALRGLELGEEYVSDKSYYAKSELLKSSLGGHGH